ncbi:theronine dehydrogenase-like Zn-dependent dehydrogenase [Pseudomonas sp. GM33]|uniref:zinc-dependent alcohol dehydrogenase n=1 Tax=Pseudomonas sp. GM33 TaxID=1144329 RepID=UPI00026FF1E8|nr:alcohol dehydrogenase catalytic domain-containing protein [Pseudomonas sp. GM33]EJM34486.1 theronine dehydrogenase-like Zn-dependent dehydrogenase [Pseudomonas sp. GM33]
MNKMLAARANKGSTDLSLELVDVPEPGPRDVLLKIASAGLAPGTFALLERGGFLLQPTTIGHEAAGTVTAVGQEVTSFKVGDRVRLNPTLSCTNCNFCRSGQEHMCPHAAMIGFIPLGKDPTPLFARYHDGCLAEFVCAPDWLLDKLPDAISFEVGAKMQDLGVAWRALASAAIPPGGTVAITAATGAMAAATIKLASFFGVGRLVLIGRSAVRLSAMKSLSTIPTDFVALESLNADWADTEGLTGAVAELIPGGIDVILDYSSTTTGVGFLQVINSLVVGGTFVHVGSNMAVLPVPLAKIMGNCWKIVGTRNTSRSDTDAVMKLLEQRLLNVDELITHRFALADLKEVAIKYRSRELPMWMGVVAP